MEVVELSSEKEDEQSASEKKIGDDEKKIEKGEKKVEKKIDLSRCSTRDHKGFRHKQKLEGKVLSLLLTVDC